MHTLKAQGPDLDLDFKPANLVGVERRRNTRDTWPVWGDYYSYSKRQPLLVPMIIMNFIKTAIAHGTFRNYRYRRIR